jgi:hypothetical protein
MNDPFVAREWAELCDGVRKCADLAGKLCGDDQHFVNAADGFCTGQRPQRYGELLERVRDAAQLAISWQDESRTEIVNHHVHDEAMIDECGDESFPASDPPEWNSAHA